MLINFFMLPYVHYCSTTWSSASTSLLRKLQSTCDKCLTLSEDIKPVEVRKRLDYDLILLGFKALNNLTSTYLSDRLSQSLVKHNHNTLLHHHNILLNTPLAL